MIGKLRDGPEHLEKFKTHSIQFISKLLCWRWKAQWIQPGAGGSQHWAYYWGIYEALHYSMLSCPCPSFHEVLRSKPLSSTTLQCPPPTVAGFGEILNGKVLWAAWLESFLMQKILILALFECRFKRIFHLNISVITQSEKVYCKFLCSGENKDATSTI